MVIVAISARPVVSVKHDRSCWAVERPVREVSLPNQLNEPVPDSAKFRVGKSPAWRHLRATR